MNKKNLRNILIAVILLAILMIYPFIPRIRQALASTADAGTNPVVLSLLYERTYLIE